MDREKLGRELYNDEGFKPYVYKDSLGFDTIGIGLLCDKRKIGSGLTLDEGLFLLGNRIKILEAELDRRIPWWRQLSENRQRALANMAYQLGVDGLMGFVNSLLALKDALTTGGYDRAANMFLQSKWAKQTPARAARVTDMLRRG